AIARHRPVDRRHLPAVLPWTCRRLPGRRSRRAGGGAHRLQSAQAAGRQGAQQDRRGVAAVAGRGGASVLGLLSRGQAPRGHLAAGEEAGCKIAQEDGAQEKVRQDIHGKETEEWLISTARVSNRARAPPNSSSCSCTAMAPTATT